MGWDGTCSNLLYILELGNGEVAWTLTYIVAIPKFQNGWLPMTARLANVLGMVHDSCPDHTKFPLTSGCEIVGDVMTARCQVVHTNIPVWSTFWIVLDKEMHNTRRKCLIRNFLMCSNRNRVTIRG